MLGMTLFSKEILTLLYGTGKSSNLLVLAGVMALIMPYIQTTTAMLQTLGKVWLPICASIGAVVLKALLNSLFIGKFGIEGAMISTICAFSLVFVFNTVLLMRTVSLKGLFKPVFKIILCALISVLGARLLYSATGGTLMLLVSVTAAGTVYLAGVIFTRVLNKKEFFTK
jgi:O-antigen/teichoic acid export membrane protein